jgi:hypothetical protein
MQLIVFGGAGHSWSFDPEVYKFVFSLRIQPTCYALGQAAGTAGALAVKANISPKQVNVRDLQEKLDLVSVPRL